MKKTILTSFGEIDTSAYGEITLNSEMAMIYLTGEDTYHEAILQIQISFSDRFTAKEAFDRISTEDEEVDLTDMRLFYDIVGEKRISDYLKKLKNETERSLEHPILFDLDGNKMDILNSKS